MSTNPKHNLEARTLTLSRQAIAQMKKIKLTPINQPLIKQLVRSIASIGANYREATEAESKKDFAHKIAICKKEAKESLYWLKLLESARPEPELQLSSLYQETHEQLLIFSKIITTCRSKSKPQ